MMTPSEYFQTPSATAQKQYEALRRFFVDHQPAETVAKQFGYKLSAFYSLVRDFRAHLNSKSSEDFFFKGSKKGRGFKSDTSRLQDLIVALRKKNFSALEIKALLEAQGHTASESYIALVLKQEGFARLPRRDRQTKMTRELPHQIEAPKSISLSFHDEQFRTQVPGLFCFLPYLVKYQLLNPIGQSLYPESNTINKEASLLAFLALKLSNVRRYSVDDLWCMDRGAGLFAHLNVLPKAAWFSSYSHQATRKMNIAFLKALHTIWKTHHLLADTANLDFTRIPYWGEATHLETNWSGKRHQSLASLLAVLAQDPDSGLIDYGDTTVLHKNEHAVILEFLDVYKEGGNEESTLKYLVFDSKFTNYENLRTLDEQHIKFLTIRRRGKKILERINALGSSDKKRIRVACAGNTPRTVFVYDETIFLNGYGKDIRQIVITGHGKLKPALFITNDFDLPVEIAVRKYARRWLVEKTISEQIEFFHLNRLSSSLVIKVDFDLTMTILAHNLYRLLAMDLERYTHLTAMSLYEKFILNSGEIEVTNEAILVKLRKKRQLPVLLTTMQQYNDIQYPHLGNKKLIFSGMATL
jgi:hypothetical protein